MSDGLWVMGGLDMVTIVGVGVSRVRMTDGLSVMGRPKMGSTHRHGGWSVRGRGVDGDRGDGGDRLRCKDGWRWHVDC